MKQVGLVLLMFFAASTAHAVDRVAVVDKNGDNKLTLSEIREVCKLSASLFNAADKNKDGFLNVKEVRTGKRYLFANCKVDPRKV